MLIGAEQFIGEVSETKMCYVKGHFGSGKTLGSLQIVEPFLKQGYRLLSNIKCVWNDDLDKVHLYTEGEYEGTVRAVVLLDEVGRHLKLRRQVEEVCTYAGKMDIIYVSCGKYPPSRYFQELVCEAGASYKAGGIPLVMYYWRFSQGIHKMDGKFSSWDESGYYGLYSRKSPEVYTDRLIFKIRELTQEFLDYDKKHGGEGGVLQSLSSVQEADGRDTFMEDITGAVEEVAEVADDLQTLVARKSRRRR